MTSMFTRRSFLGAAAAASLVALAGCAPPSRAVLRMACGEPGGTYIRFGELLRAALDRAGAPAALEVLETTGSRENLERVREGTADLAISLADSIGPEDSSLVAVGRVYQNYLQLIVRADAGITDVEQLRGRSVSIGAPLSGTALTARRVLTALGLDRGTSIEVEELRLDDAIAGVIDGSLGALFWSGGVPLPALATLATTVRVALLDLSPALPYLARQYPGVYRETVIPAGVYGLADNLPAIGVSNVLLTRPDLSGELVRAVVDRLIDDARSLVYEPSVGVQFLTLSNLIDTAGVPLHPAAAERYAQRYG